MSDNASDYFRRLCRTLGAMLATDGRGEPVPIDAASQRAVEQLLDVRRRGGKVMLIGNGGSAAVVAHVQNDLCKACGVRAMTFTEPSTLTAYSNDDGYAAAYERQIKHWADEGDLLIAVSSSGVSENMRLAADAARDARCAVITMTGFQPNNPLRQRGDVNFYCPDQSYGLVELSHAVLGHYLTDAVMAATQDGAAAERKPYDIRIATARVGDRRRGLRRRRASA